MTRYIGIDESVVEIGYNKNLFIYVACSSNKDYFGEEKNNGYLKKRITENDFSLDLDGLDGFVFKTVVINASEKKDGQRQRLNKEGRRVQQVNIIYDLTKQIIDLSRENDLLDDRLKIQIDGSDSYSITKELVQKLEKESPGLKTAVEFIPKGDEKVRVINLADTFAYLLRGLELKEMSPQDIGELEKIYENANPRVKKILPFHMRFRSKENLESRVA